jgi:hypothetical protein
MKAIVSVLLFIVMTVTVSAQHDTTTYVYCEVIAVAKYGSQADDPTNNNFIFDFGKEDASIVKGADGKQIEFKTEMEVLNFLEGFKWHLHTSTCIGLQNWKWVLRYVLRKPKYGLK